MKRQENNGTIATVSTGNTFKELLTKYELAYLTDPHGQDYTDALQELGTIIAYSVLRKCIDVSHNESLIDVRHDVAMARRSLDTLERANKELYTLTYNEDGDLISKLQKEEYVTRKDKNGKEKKVKKENALETAFNKLVRETLGDGLDLVNTAIATLISETEKHGADLEKEYTIRRLKRKVYIKLEDSVNGWEEVETSPIRETYKAVRREIENSRAIATDPRNGYSYLEDIATDSETGEETTVYRRLDKYSDLGGNMSEKHAELSDPLTIICNSESHGTMSHGTMYSADASIVNDMDTLVESLNLTERQATTLKLRLRGYGYKAIGTYLGIRYDSVRDCMRAIQNKVKNSDSFNKDTLARYINK